MKPTWCTRIHQGLSRGTKAWQQVLWFERSQHDKTTNNLFDK